MGISFSFCNAQWSYKGYANFRYKLARAIGIDQNAKEWPSREQEPLVILLDSPDDGGQFSPEECALMIQRLRDVLESIKIDEDDLDYERGKALLRGMKRAVKRKRPLTYF